MYTYVWLFSFCELSLCFYLLHKTDGCVLPLQTEKSIWPVTGTIGKFCFLNCSRSPPKTEFSRKHKYCAQVLPGGNLLNCICVGLSTWVIEWPICSHCYSPWEAGIATTKLNAPHSLHNYWRETHQIALPCRGPSMWERGGRGEEQTGQMSSTGKNKQHICKLCLWSYLWRVGVNNYTEYWLSWEGASREGCYSENIFIYSLYSNM